MNKVILKLQLVMKLKLLWIQLRMVSVPPDYHVNAQNVLKPGLRWKELTKIKKLFAVLFKVVSKAALPLKLIRSEHSCQDHLLMSNLCVIPNILKAKNS